MTDDAPTPATPAATLASPFTPARLAGAALAVSVVALGLAASPMLTGGDFGGRVRTYLLANPQVLDEVIQARDANANTDRIASLNTAVAANPSALVAGPMEPAFGPADARVTVVEFFDYQCPYCKQATPALLQLVEANPDVRFIFKEWPILDRGDDVTSQYAARAAIAAHAQGKYLAVHEALMAEPALDVAAIDRVLATNGVTAPADTTGLGSPEITRVLADVHTGAASIGLQGTPTFFINGQASPTNDPAELARVIAAAKG